MCCGVVCCGVAAVLCCVMGCVGAVIRCVVFAIPQLLHYVTDPV